MKTQFPHAELGYFKAFVKKEKKGMSRGLINAKATSDDVTKITTLDG